MRIRQFDAACGCRSRRMANEQPVMNFIWLSALRSSPQAFDKSIYIE
jgi:hypothetical protein